jgi:hypothetical protein
LPPAALLAVPLLAGLPLVGLVVVQLGVPLALMFLSGLMCSSSS